jgi:phenylalanine ammonia-lyase
MDIADFLMEVLAKDMMPLIPTRGSVSASGDLTPLAYLGGLLEGNPDIPVRITDRGDFQIVSADEALRRANMAPLKLQGKEGLGLMNGTAPSSSAAALVVHDSHILAVLVQILTAMSTEALQGTVNNYHDFISTCRPHPGQREVAGNIRRFLCGSKLAQGMEGQLAGLVQDRYDLRTAPQWIGPQVEDLLAADGQVSIELNATTDNPLIDAQESSYHHGGNFQATVITSAMDKTRTSLLMLGKLLLAQSQQMVDPLINNGLPPNLCVEDPSLSFTAKGLDVNMAAYCSELGFLTNSVVSNIHSAEMRNQSVNSLALLSARYTATCVEVLTMMCAAHIYIVCQALDLRVMQMEFFKTARAACEASFHGLCNHIGIPEDALSDSHFDQIWSAIRTSWLDRNRLDLEEKCAQVSRDCLGQMVSLDEIGYSRQEYRELIQRWKEALPTILEDSHRKTREAFTKNRVTPQYLAQRTEQVYRFVREQLQVPFHLGIKDHPVFDKDDAVEVKRTIGTYVSRIFTAIRNEEMARLLLDVMEGVDTSISNVPPEKKNMGVKA